MWEPQTLLVVALTGLAIGIIPVMVQYYRWLTQHILPHLVSLPIRLAIVILGLWIALPWVALTTVVWLARR